MTERNLTDRAAIILYGIVGGLIWRDGHGGHTNISDCAKTLKYCITSQYPCDIFIHSWSVEHQESLLENLSPTNHLIQKQEMFGFSLSEHDRIYGDFPSLGSCFRAMSRWESTARAIKLKQDYEARCGSKYKYAMLARIDLAYMSVKNINNFSPDYVYVCHEPVFCPDNFIDPRFNTHCVDDKIFLSSSLNIDRFTEVAQELRLGRYGFTAWNSHLISYDKIIDIVGTQDKIKYGFETYLDVDVYRTALNFSNGIESARMQYCALHNINMRNRLNNILELAYGQK